MSQSERNSRLVFLIIENEIGLRSPYTGENASFDVKMCVYNVKTVYIVQG